MNLTLKASELAQVSKLLYDNSGESRLVYITTSEGAVFFTTVGKTGRLSIACPAEVNQQGVVYCSMSRLEAYATACADGPMIMEVAGDSLKLTGSGMTGYAPLMDSKDFVGTKRFDETSPRSTFDAESFKQAVDLESIVPLGVAQDFTGCFYIETLAAEGILMVTDRAQLISRRFKCEGQPLKASVPVGFFKDVVALSTGSITVVSDESTLRLKTDKYIADFNLQPQHMPSARVTMIRAIGECPGLAKLPLAPITRALTLAKDLGEKRANFYIYLDWSPVGCMLRANGDRTDEIYCDLGGTSTTEVRIYLAHDRLLRALKHFEKLKFLVDDVTFRYTSALSPVFISLSPDAEDFYVISPLAKPMHENK